MRRHGAGRASAAPAPRTCGVRGIHEETAAGCLAPNRRTSVVVQRMVRVDQEGYQKDNSSNSAHAGSDEWLLRRVYRQTTSLRQSGTEKVRGHTAYLASKDHGPRQGSSAQGQQRKPNDGARNEQHVPRCRGDFQPLPAVDSICFRTAWDE